MKLIHPTNLANFSLLIIGEATIYFSYETPIAVISPNGFCVTENKWGSTTGKHINYVKNMYPMIEQLDHEKILRYIKEEVRNAYE